MTIPALGTPMQMRKKTFLKRNLHNPCCLIWFTLSLYESLIWNSNWLCVDISYHIRLYLNWAVHCNNTELLPINIPE